MNVIITDTAIADSKLMLMSDRPIDHLRAVQWLWEILCFDSGYERDRFINRLIDADVVSYLCEKMCEHHGVTFTIMLNIVDKLRFNDLFYKYKLAYRAIGSIARVANIMSQNMAAHEETLSLIAYTIYAVLNGASSVQVSLDTVCNVEQIVLFIKNLCPLLSKKYILRLSAARTLILVMKNIRLGNNEEVKSSLLRAFTDSLASIRAIVLQHIDSTHSEILHSAMEIMISTCTIGTRFCEETTDGARYISGITEELTETIIPNFGKVKFPNGEYEKNQKKLIECLARILCFKCCDRNLAVVLTTNGFITSFFESSSTSLRASMQSIVLDVIVTLSEYADDWAILERSFNGDNEPITAIEYPKLISEFLVSIVEGSSKDLLNRAIEAITRLEIKDKYRSIICARVWNRLPIALASSSVNNATNVEGLIRLAQRTQGEDTFLEIHREAVTALTKVLTTKDIGNHFKNLLLQCLYTTLTAFPVRKSSQVVDFIVNKTDLLTILRDEGFPGENYELSGVCVDLLACIDECDRKFQVQGEVVKIEPLKMSDLLGQSDYEICRAAMRLLIRLLNPGEAVPLVILSDFENVQVADKVIFDWYMKLHVIFAKTQISDWRLVYGCLWAVLNFCEQSKNLRILRRLCDCSKTLELVRTTIDLEYTDSTFFEFVHIWVDLRCHTIRRVPFRH